MTSEEAIKIINCYDIGFYDLSGEKIPADKLADAFDMAIEALQNADRKTEPSKEQNFCGKCRYLYRDFKYGLSCYRLMDNEPCKYEERKTEPTGYNLSPVEDEQTEREGE